MTDREKYEEDTSRFSVYAYGPLWCGKYMHRRVQLAWEAVEEAYREARKG